MKALNDLLEAADSRNKMLEEAFATAAAYSSNLRNDFTDLIGQVTARLDRIEAKLPKS